MHRRGGGGARARQRCRAGPRARRDPPRRRRRQPPPPLRTQQAPRVGAPRRRAGGGGGGGGCCCEVGRGGGGTVQLSCQALKLVEEPRGVAAAGGEEAAHGCVVPHLDVAPRRGGEPLQRRAARLQPPRREVLVALTRLVAGLSRPCSVAALHLAVATRLPAPRRQLRPERPARCCRLPPPSAARCPAYGLPSRHVALVRSPRPSTRRKQAPATRGQARSSTESTFARIDFHQVRIAADTILTMSAFRGLKCAIPTLGGALRSSRTPVASIFRTATPFAARSFPCGCSSRPLQSCSLRALHRLGRKAPGALLLAPPRSATPTNARASNPMRARRGAPEVDSSQSEPIRVATISFPACAATLSAHRPCGPRTRSARTPLRTA